MGFFEKTLNPTHRKLQESRGSFERGTGHRSNFGVFRVLGELPSAQVAQYPLILNLNDVRVPYLIWVVF